MTKSALLGFRRRGGEGCRQTVMVGLILAVTRAEWNDVKGEGNGSESSFVGSPGKPEYHTRGWKLCASSVRVDTGWPNHNTPSWLRTMPVAVGQSLTTAN